MSWSRAAGGVSGAVQSKSSPCGPELNRDRISPAFWTQLIGCRQEHHGSHQSGGSSGSFPLLCILSDPSHLVRFKTRGRLSADSREFHPSSLNLPHELRTSTLTPLPLHCRALCQKLLKIDFLILKCERLKTTSCFVVHLLAVSFTPQHCGWVLHESFSSWTEFITWPVLCPVRIASVPSSHHH